MLNIIDDYMQESLAIRIGRRLNSTSVIDLLSDLFLMRGIPKFIRSDNRSEFIVQIVQDWIRAVGAKTNYITPGSP
jgi:putative transposase